MQAIFFKYRHTNWSSKLPFLHEPHKVYAHNVQYNISSVATQSWETSQCELKCKIFSSFKHLPNLLELSLPHLIRQQCHNGNLPIFSLYKDFNFIETALFSHTYFISLYVVWWSYLIAVTMHTAQPGEKPENTQQVVNQTEHSAGGGQCGFEREEREPKVQGTTETG